MICVVFKVTSNLSGTMSLGVSKPMNESRKTAEAIVITTPNPLIFALI